MKKIIFSIITMLISTSFAMAQQVAEKLNRAPIAVKASNGVLVSWRSLKEDPEGISFNVYRDGTQIASNLSTKTNILDAAGKGGETYKLETVVNGTVVETNEVKAWKNMFMSVKVNRPSAITASNGGSLGYYFPDDMSVGDLDGDGDYELILKWMPNNSQDSGSNGQTSPCIIDAYEMDGTQLWRINLGKNIRTGNHYTQFLVYDLDGDGKAEMICKTAPNSKDGKGHFVTEAATDENIKKVDNNKNCINGNGHSTSGEEFLTVFNGQTGAAMHTVWYNPPRSAKPFETGATSYGGWESVIGKGTNYNRGERYNISAAYLDGLDKLPSAIIQRGYYTYAFFWAVDWNGKELKTRWLHAGDSNSTWKTYDSAGKEIYNGSGKSSFGQGVHGISVGDVDLDGFDEIVMGSATIDHEGKLLCSTGLGHGDAIHLADLCPDRPGLEIMMPHEEEPFGYDVHDATTGEFIVEASYPNGTDNGRGLACDFIPSNKGSEFWSSCPTKYNKDTKTTEEKDNTIHSCTDGSKLNNSMPDTNFRIYWTGDPFDQTFDGRYDSNSGKSSPRIRNWKTSSKSIGTFLEFSSHGAPQTCNTTKATPCLQADLFGDWREELIMYQYEADTRVNTMTLMIFSTPEPTNYKVPCLMQDHVYRMGVAWQNSSYNQPPHLGYSLAESLGINRNTYVTQTANHAPKYQAPEADPDEEKMEYVPVIGTDKSVAEGESYTFGKNGEFAVSTKDFSKIRTSENNETWVINVKEGFIITGISIDGYSNNNSVKADRSIYLDAVYVDNSETSILDSKFAFPGGTAGQNPVTCNIKGLNAKNNIVLHFDNSNIVTSQEDYSGKNKQLYANITITYKKADATGISKTVNTVVSNGAIYNIQGQKIEKVSRPGLYIINGKKYSVK